MIAIWISCPSKKNADNIARELVTQKLIYFAQIFPVDSVYWLNGKINPDHQFVIFGELEEINLEKTEKELTRLHDDKIPCWTVFSIQKISSASEKWIKEN